jgi:hypothetical protein
MTNQMLVSRRPIFEEAWISLHCFDQTIGDILQSANRRLDRVSDDIAGAILSITRAQGLDCLEYKHFGYVKTGWVPRYVEPSEFPKRLQTYAPALLSPRDVDVFGNHLKYTIP